MSGFFTWQAAPSGDSCLVLVFASELSIQANRQAAAAAAILNHARDAGRMPGLTDIVPGMVTVGVHYRPERIAMATGEPSPYAALLGQIQRLLADYQSTAVASPRRIEIALCYGGEHGPDLQQTAQACGVSAEQLIELHSRDWLDVLMIGFTPGHPYIGILDPLLDLPRRSTPRTWVPRGSVGLANRQTNVYPVDSPGGWHLIGRTPLAMFNAQNQPPCLLQSGDQVRFVAIDSATFDALLAEQQS
jgi:KipI family sensor histidine kinase inhibitor